MKLSFVEYDEDGSVKQGWVPGGDGACRAEELVSYTRMTGDVPMFTRVIRDVVKAEQNGKSPETSAFLFRIGQIIERARLAITDREGFS